MVCSEIIRKDCRQLCKIDDKEMMNQNNYLYIADGNNEIYKKLVENREEKYIMISDDVLFKKDEGEEFPNRTTLIKILKTQFSPLLEKQDILILDCDFHIIEKISYMSVEKEKHFQQFRRVMNHRDDSQQIKKIAGLVIEYMMSKNILVLKKIYEECKRQNRKFNPLILKKMRAYLALSVPDERQAEEVIEWIYKIFNGEDCEIKREMNKKYNISDSLKKHCQNLKEYKKHAAERIEQDNKKKNLIVFHMESISNEIFGNHRYEFRDIEKLMSQSLNFGKFYSSATSSAMAISDFIHGNDFEMDRFTNFHDMRVDGRYGKGLYKILEEQGYVTLGIGYNYFPETEEVNSHGIWDSECGNYKWINDFENFMEEVVSFIEKNHDRAFAIHVWNLMPHVGQKCLDTEEAVNFYDRINMAYESLNMTIGKICDILEKNKLMESTVIAGYGDHGDDKWTRSMNAGFTHTIEPYHNIINTPAFIFDSRLEPVYSDELMSLVDMKRTLLYLTGNGIVKEFAEAGINLFQEENNYVFSKRLFANQQYYEDIKAYPMMKLHNFSDKEYRNPAYAIIGKKYTLLVSNYGCELFMNQLDPFSYNNVLNFYQMDEEGNLAGFNNRGAWRGHFRTIMMQEEQVYDVISAFYEMSELLRERIRCHEKMAGNEEAGIFDEKNFLKIRIRGFIEE